VKGMIESLESSQACMNVTMGKSALKLGIVSIIDFTNVSGSNDLIDSFVVVQEHCVSC